jgi:hypothetical protein
MEDSCKRSLKIKDNRIIKLKGFIIFKKIKKLLYLSGHKLICKRHISLTF